MRVLSQILGCGLLLLFLGACSKPPKIPSLGDSVDSPTDRLVLDSTLSAKDYREIFHAINRKGKLDALKPYLDVPSEQSLEALGDIFSRRIYETALSQDGPVSLLESRIQDRTFSKWRTVIKKWESRPQFIDEKKAVLALVKQEAIQELISFDSGFFDPEWARLLGSLRSAKERYQETENWEATELPSSKEVVADLQTMLRSPIREELPKRLVAWKREGFGGFILQALFEMRESGQPGKKIADGRAFEGLSRGLGALLENAQNENSLHTLLEFQDLINAPSNGLFSAISEKFIAEPDYGNEIAKLFRPLSSRALNGYLKEILSQRKLFDEEGRYYDKAFWLNVARRDENQKPSQEFIDLFIAIRTAMERIAGPARSIEDSRDAFLHNLPIYTTAFALTKWCEAVVRENHNAWQKAPDEKFYQKIWELPLSLKELAVDLSGRGMQNGSDIEDLGKIGLSDFAKQIQEIVSKEGFGNFYYRFREVNGSTFGQALQEAVELAEEVRPASDPGALIRALIFPLTRDGESALLSFQKWETPNLFTSLNKVLLQLSPSTWKSLKQTLFEQFQLGKLKDPDFDTRRLILEFYPEEPLKARVGRILDGIPLIEDFDKSVKGLPSPFEAYTTFLRNVPVSQFPEIAASFHMVTQAEWLAGTATAPHTPTVFKTVKQGKLLGSLLYAFSHLTQETHADFFRPFWRALGNQGEGLRSHFSVLEVLVDSHPQALASLLSRAFEHCETLWDWYEAVSESERAYLVEFLPSRDAKETIRFFHQEGSQSDLLDLVKELKVLSQSGYLLEAFKLLKQIQSERMRRIAEVLLQWQESGELLAFLDSLEVILN